MTAVMQTSIRTIRRKEERKEGDEKTMIWEDKRLGRDLNGLKREWEWESGRQRMCEDDRITERWEMQTAKGTRMWRSESPTEVPLCGELKCRKSRCSYSWHENGMEWMNESMDLLLKWETGPWESGIWAVAFICLLLFEIQCDFKARIETQSSQNCIRNLVCRAMEMVRIVERSWHKEIGGKRNGEVGGSRNELNPLATRMKAEGGNLVKMCVSKRVEYD